MVIGICRKAYEEIMSETKRSATLADEVGTGGWCVKFIGLVNGYRQLQYKVLEGNGQARE